MRRALAAACAAACLSLWSITILAYSQSDETAVSEASAASGLDAYVYVSNVIGSTGKTEIHAFAAAANGRLTAVPGSPFADDVGWMAVNGLYLFGSDTSGTFINAYSIESDGALRYAASTNVVQPGNCDTPGAVFFDHTGATLYNTDYLGNNCANTVYQSFAVEKATGKLKLVNEAGAGINYTILSFIGNNKFAYESDCVKGNAVIDGYRRSSDGSLTELNNTPPWPTPPPNLGWCPYLAAADTTNHLAVPMYPSPGLGQGGPYQLATYTADSNTGTLTTSSTYKNMPTVTVGSVNYLQMAPSGKLLAVAGTSGLEIFHFNGAGPITTYTGALVKDEVDQMFWDNDNHLYAISQKAGKLYVFTITPTAHSQALGSPYSIKGAVNIIVQPWPLPWK